MDSSVTRRGFVQALSAGAGVVAGFAANESSRAETTGSVMRIVGVACSPRKGKTTAQALSICLEAAKAVNPERIETELIELADLEIPAYVAAGIPLKPGQTDDFPDLSARLVAPEVVGIIIGTPVYFGSMSASARRSSIAVSLCGCGNSPWPTRLAAWLPSAASATVDRS